MHTLQFVQLTKMINIIIAFRAGSSDIEDCQDVDSKVPLEYMSRETPISAVLPVALRKVPTVKDLVSQCYKISYLFSP